MSLLVAYDITDNKLRAKVAKKLLYFGLERIQYSVFLGSIKHNQKAGIVSSLEQLVKAKGGPNDSIILLDVSSLQIQNMFVLGKQELDLAYLSGASHTIYM